MECQPCNTGHATDNYNYAQHAFTVGKLEQGTTYTVSADVEITAGSFDEISFIFFNAVIDTRQTEDTVFAIVDGHVTATVQITGSDAERMLIYAGRGGETRGNEIRITNLKLEKGGVVTGWTLAPEDSEV